MSKMLEYANNLYFYQCQSACCMHLLNLFFVCYDTLGKIDTVTVEMMLAYDHYVCQVTNMPYLKGFN